MFHRSCSWVSGGVIALLAVCCLTQLPAQDAKDPTTYFHQLDKAAQQTASLASTNNLRQIAFAVHTAHDAHNELPGNITDKLSWRVSILRFLGKDEDALFKQFKLDEPWDGPNNKKLIDRMPKVYRNPRFQKADDKTGATYYQGFSGVGGLMDKKRLSLGEIVNANGASNTFLVVEAGEAVPWTKPADLPHDLKKPLPKLAGGGDYFLAAFADGHVQRIPAKTNEKTLRCMIQWNNTTAFELP